MARGYKDHDKGYMYGEISTRPSLLFGTGKVLVQDNFECPYTRWTATVSNLGTVNVTTYHGLEGCGGLWCRTDVNIGDYAGISRNVFLPQSLKIGCECAFTMIQNNCQYFQVRIIYYTGIVRYVFEVRYNFATLTWQYWDNAGAWQNITGGTQSLRDTPTNWHKIKLTIDSSSVQYVSLRVDNVFYDLTGISGQTVADATGASVVARIIQSTSAAANQNFYLDCCSITEE